MASTAPIPEARRIPMTYERALTAVTQARFAIMRAHRDMAEALEIIAGRQTDGSSLGEATQRAARLLHVASALKQLDAVRADLLARLDGSSPASLAIIRSRVASKPSEPAYEGEFPPIEERLVVSPGWGHLHRRRLREGRPLIQGAVIGEIRAGKVRTVVRSPVAAVFLAWLVSEGDRVDVGRPLASIQPDRATPR
jgi:biotin carboxyl carrier protein